MKQLILLLLLSWQALGASESLAQTSEEKVLVEERPAQSIHLRPGFQQEVVIRGDVAIGSISIGDPTVAAITTTSDRRFIINGLSPEKADGVGIRATNILVHDNNKNIIASLDVEVGYFPTAGSHMVEIHKRVGGNATGNGARSEQYAGVDKYICSSVRCDLISRDLATAPAQLIQQESKNYNYSAPPK